MRRIGLTVTALAVGTLLAVPVHAEDAMVHNEGANFVPQVAQVGRGDQVTWTIAGPHTVTDATGMGQYDRDLSPGGSFTRAFVAAGRYHYICKFHVGSGMRGRIEVPVSAVDAEGRGFVVTWASQSGLNRPWVYDVQVKRPDSTQWTWWLRGVEARSRTYAPASLPGGTYRFRARMREPGEGASGWSATAAVS